MHASNTINTAQSKSGLDILFAAIDYQQSSNAPSPTPSSSASSKSPAPNQASAVSVNPFRSKMDPRMKKSIEAKASIPNISDEKAVLAGFVFPERGLLADIKWIGEDNVSMRQRKINFRRSWKRFSARQQSEKVSAEEQMTPVTQPTNSVTVIPSSPSLSSMDAPDHEDVSSMRIVPSDHVYHIPDDNHMISRKSEPLALPKKGTAGSFPRILLDVVSNPAYDHIISWLPSGDAFAIHDRKEFESQLLPTYFRQARLDSFIRKLNRWGFRRMNKNKDDVSSRFRGSTIFSHDNFKRDDRRRMAKISLCDGISAFREVSMDKTMSNEAATRPTTSTAAMLIPDDLVVPHRLVSSIPSPDLRMIELNLLLTQRHQHLYCMSQKTKYSRALLHSMQW